MPVSAFECAGGDYWFVLHLDDDHAADYRDHRRRPPLDINGRAVACSGERFYSGAAKYPQQLTGACAHIKCRDVKPCNERPCKPETHSCAYVNVSRAVINEKWWAQIGWAKSNHALENQVVRRTYFELFGGPDVEPLRRLGIDPGNDSVNQYKVVLADVSMGEWKYYYDGQLVARVVMPTWANHTGTCVMFYGEIYRKQSDMPGVTWNRCSFGECKYKTASLDWVDAGLTDTNMYSNDSSKWPYNRLSQTAFEIWDASPL